MERSTPEQAAEYYRVIDIAMDAIYECVNSTVAFIKGFCVGGALDLTAFCDERGCGRSGRFRSRVFAPQTTISISVSYNRYIM